VSDVDQVVARVKAKLKDLIVKPSPGRTGLMLPESAGMVHLKSADGVVPIVVTTTSAGADQACDTVDRAAEVAIARLRELPRRWAGARQDASKPPKPPKTIVEILAIKDARKFRDALTESLGSREWADLNPVERGILAIWGLEAEVNNGAFAQYFDNSSGEQAVDALRGLTLIGAAKCAKLLSKAMAVFPGGTPSADRKTRRKQTQALGEAVDEVWGPLSNEFSDYPDDLNRLILEYCLAHRGEFGAADIDQVVARMKTVLPDLIVQGLPGRPGLSIPKSDGWVLLLSTDGAAPFTVKTTQKAADLTCATIEEAAEKAISRLKELPVGGEGYPKGRHLLGVFHGTHPKLPPPKPPKPIAVIFAIEDPHEFRDALTYSLVHRGAADLNPVERALWAIWWLEADANNGSFDQYFHNSTGDDAADALRGLTLIGALKCADLLRKAMAVFPGGAPSTDQVIRKKQIQTLGYDEAVRIWDPLSNEFTDYPEDLNRLIREYCLAHRAEFGA